MLTSGLTMTNQQSGILGMAESLSPIPSASIVPPVIEKGTSAPHFAPSSQSSSGERGSSKSLLRPKRTAAASALPPAIPACFGIRLSISIFAPESIPVFSKKSSAAWNAMFELPSRVLSLQQTAIPSYFVIFT